MTMKVLNYIVTVNDVFGFTICRGLHGEPHHVEAVKEGRRRLEKQAWDRGSYYATAEEIYACGETVAIAGDNPGYKIENEYGLCVKAVEVK